MEARRKGLGRGLDALIPGAASPPDQKPGDQSPWIPVEAIRPSPYQPREAFAEDSIEELAASIRQKGLLQPLLVRRMGDGYELIAGERRFRAAQRAGLSRVPVAVRDASDRESLELALIENLQRENLNPIEEARAYQRLGDEFGLKHEQIAEQVGKNRSTVTNSLRLLQLPVEIREQIEAGILSAGHARSILALPSAAAQKDAARAVVGKGLTVRDTERLVRQRTRAQTEANQQALEAELSRALGTRVRVRQAKGGKGRIEIEYYSLAELDGLVDRLTERKQPQ